MNQNRILHRILIIAVVCIAGRGISQTIPIKIEKIMNEIYPEDQPGAALLVLKDDTPLIRDGFGIANLENGEKISPETQFRMASVSKQFTAMATLLAVKKAGLNLNNSITTYLPSLPGFTGDISIRQLLTHTSGIADYEPLISESQTEQVSDAEVLKILNHSDSLYFPAGEKFKYSNTGFCLLTQIIEETESVSYRDFIQEHIFRPLQMDNTMIYDPEKSIKNRAYGYHFSDKKWQFADQSLTSATMGDGSVYTSIKAYEKWIKSLWDSPLTEEEENPLFPQVFVCKGIHYGYGWFTGLEEDGSRAFFHSGETTGFHNIVYHNPSKKTLFVLFSNADDDRIALASKQIMALLNIRLKAVSSEHSLFNVLSEIYEES